MSLEYVDSKFQNSDQVTVVFTDDLPAGDYIVLVEIEWNYPDY
jgi:hypothetical protein